MALVQTVLGLVTNDQLGIVLGHEHLLSLVPGPWNSGGVTDERITIAVKALSALKALGVGAICDISPYGVVGRDDFGNNAVLLRDIALQSGLHIISGTGTYLEAYSPSWVSSITLEELTDRFIKDAMEGIGNSNVKAGIYGEQATGLDEITPYEEKGLRAAARASLITGLGIKTHCTHATMAQEQINILEEEGVDLSRVVIGHIDTQVDLLDINYALQILARGTNIGIDTIGKQTWEFFLAPPEANPPDGRFTKTCMYRSDINRAEMVAELIQQGFVNQLYLAMDITGAEIYMNPETHGQLGYNYLLEGFVPLLRDRGVTGPQLTQMLVTNPARLLGIRGTR